MAGIFTSENDICGSWYSSRSAQLFLISPRGHYNVYISQAAQDVSRSQDTLIDVFEPIESFFRRLEIYAEVPATTERVDTIVRIMVEVLTILGIATKEIKQGRMSE